MMTNETVKALDALDHADALLALLSEPAGDDAADFGRALVIDQVRDHLAAAREALSWVHELGRVEAGAEPAGGA